MSVLRRLAATLLVLAFAVAGVRAGVFQTRVPPHMKHCFFEQLIIADRVDLSFQVYDGGDLDIDFWVTAPDGRMIQSQFKGTTGTFGFTADRDGKYEYCFSNQVGSAVKAVTFSVTGPEEKIRFESMYKDSQEDFHTPLNEEINNLANKIRILNDENNYLIQRELAHRNTAKSTNSRVVWWSLLQAVVLAAVAAFQVYYIMSFFNTKSRIRV
ncbi:p24 complex component [Phlyctochytrium bullatum]|nr:p24 complex component [Phlyctochytrium bullatum]